MMFDSGRAGVSRLFSLAAALGSVTEPADIAVRIAPKDPEAHYTRGLELVNANRTLEALAELRQATQIRSHHYYEWLDLGVTLDRLDDQQGALVALRESVRLAPFYAQPRWQLGNALFRQGRFDEAFTELRLGAKSDPTFVDMMIELSWTASNGNVERMIQLLAPQDRFNRLQIASFLVKHGEIGAATRQVAEEGATNNQRELVLLRQMISDLIKARNFFGAFEIWKLSHSISAEDRSYGVVNGNFAKPIAQDDPGFGWQSSPLTNVSLSIDPSGPYDGARGVRVDFRGDNEPSAPILRQFILVEPKTHYLLKFMARTEDLVTGGSPVVVVTDANSDNSRVLGQSPVLVSSNSPWSSYVVDFSTRDTASPVIEIRIQRTSCAQNACPAFGRLWVSEFKLESNHAPR